MAQLDDMDFIAVRIQRERRDLNSQLQCLAGLCNSPNQRLFGLFDVGCFADNKLLY